VAPGFPLAKIARQGFFADDVFARLGGLQDHGEMESVGNGKVHHLDGWVVQDLSVIIIAFRDAVSPRQVFGPSFAETCDCDNLYGHTLNLAVGAEMKRGCEPRTHDCDSYSFAHRYCPLSGSEALGLGLSAISMRTMHAKTRVVVCQGKSWSCFLVLTMGRESC
jgi:hypothetical protein